MATQFLDGPAEKVALSLRRAPLFLRVSFDPAAQKWDALDLLEDEPFDGEKIFVYRREGEPTLCFVDGRDPKTGKRYGQKLAIGRYRFFASQPDERTLKDNDKWQAWVKETCELEGVKIRD